MLLFVHEAATCHILLNTQHILANTIIWQTNHGGNSFQQIWCVDFIHRGQQQSSCGILPVVSNHARLKCNIHLLSIPGFNVQHGVDTTIIQCMLVRVVCRIDGLKLGHILFKNFQFQYSLWKVCNQVVGSLITWSNSWGIYRIEKVDLLQKYVDACDNPMLSFHNGEKNQIHFW